MSKEQRTIFFFSVESYQSESYQLIFEIQKIYLTIRRIPKNIHYTFLLALASANTKIVNIPKKTFQTSIYDTSNFRNFDNNTIIYIK